MARKRPTPKSPATPTPTTEPSWFKRPWSKISESFGEKVGELLAVSVLATLSTFFGLKSCVVEDAKNAVQDEFFFVQGRTSHSAERTAENGPWPLDDPGAKTSDELARKLESGLSRWRCAEWEVPFPGADVRGRAFHFAEAPTVQLVLTGFDINNRSLGTSPISNNAEVTLTGAGSDPASVTPPPAAFGTSLPSTVPNSRVNTWVSQGSTTDLGFHATACTWSDSRIYAVELAYTAIGFGHLGKRE